MHEKSEMCQMSDKKGSTLIIGREYKRVNPSQIFSIGLNILQ